MTVGRQEPEADKPAQLRPDDPLTNLRGTLAQQATKTRVEAETLATRGDETTADRLRDQAAYADDVLSQSPEDIERWGPVALTRGLLVTMMGRAEAVVNTAETTGSPGAVSGLRRALAWAEHVLAQSPEEQAQELFTREFMGALVHHLVMGDRRRLSCQERVIQPFGVPGLVVTAAGVPGKAVVRPISRQGHLVRGQAEYELRIGDQDGEAWISRPTTLLVSPDPAAIIAAIVAWRDATPLPAPETPPLRAADLAPLRALAATRRDLARAAGAGTDWSELDLALGFDPAAPIEIQRGAGAAPSPEAARAVLLALLGEEGARDPRFARWLAGGPPESASKPPPVNLTAVGAATLASDLAHLDAARLLGNMPRDAKSRLSLGQEVLLATYATDQADMPGRRSQFWLVARAPARRADAQTVTLVVELLLGDNRRHRWDEARWLWDGRVQATSETRWGVAGLEARRLGLAGRTEEIARLWAIHEDGRLSPAERVALVILLQDEGRLTDAYAVGDVALAPPVLDLLTGGNDTNLAGKQAISWPLATRDMLRAAAPWRFEALLSAEEVRLAAWLAEKRGRRRKPARLRLMALPNQPHIQKASFMLARGADGRPELTVETTGSEVIVPEVHWRRPVDLDLERFGLVE